MSASDLEISVILRQLDQPVTDQERADGWTEKSKKNAYDYMLSIKTSLQAGTSLPPLDIVRGLDHQGVVGGELLEGIAAFMHSVRAHLAERDFE